jgi:hypothetical protein
MRHVTCRGEIEGHVESMGGMRTVYKILVGKPERKNHSEDLGVNGK